MPNPRHLLTAARAVAIVAIVALFAKISPVLVQHAAAHSGTYAGGTVSATTWPLARGSR